MTIPKRKHLKRNNLKHVNSEEEKPNTDNSEQETFETSEFCSGQTEKGQF